MRYAFLVMVTEQNNNKFYEMVEQDNGTIQLFNGRVDVTRIEQTPKPISQWDKIYNSKLKKGYQDITDLVSKKVAKKGSVNFVDINNKEVKDVIEKLIAFSNKTVADNYNVKATSVTQKQVDSAQEIIDTVSRMLKKGTSVDDINQNLLKLFTIIPRKMKSVKDYLLEGITIDVDSSFEDAKDRISKEQDILDSLQSSVLINEAEENIEVSDVENKTILDTLGISIEPASDEDIKNIKNHLGDIRDKFQRAFVVTNKKAEKRFNDFVSKADDKKIELFWHGSRNTNWLSILQNSLMIRPSGVATVGAMFSLGIYGADKARKAFGYTSSRSAYWTKENSNVVYMAVFKFHVGKQKHIYKHDNSCYHITEQSLKKEGYDSVFAHGGYDLINNEYIIYNHSQCTIKYLVELKG